MKNEAIKAWITKYALTTGIQVADGEVCHEVNSKMFIDSKMCTFGSFNSVHRQDWHRTPEAALARAEEMRKCRIKSLKKSIAKLEALKFEDVMREEMGADK